MKFRTRITIIFVTIIILPLLLTVLAFLAIGATLGAGSGGPRPGGVVDNVQEVLQIADSTYEQLERDLQENPARLEDIDYLAQVEREIARSSTFLIVRKGEQIYYTGNPGETDHIFPDLPAYGDSAAGKNTGYYFSDLECYVRQLDFHFSDGSEGSLFVMSKATHVISRHLLLDMLIAIVLILVLTSTLMTRSIHRSIYSPISELNIAMQHIKDNDLEYVLPNDKEGEIGDLYRNYEDMRMRLKETQEEKADQEQKNRELISNISHDLKTPITSIKGYVEGILDGVADTPEKMDKYVRTIYNKATDMDRLINELTTYSHVENDRIPYKFLRINVADYFDDCVEEVGLDLEQRGIEFNYTNMISPETLVIADPEQLKKVINNIISNSVKYMDKSHKVIEIRILDEIDSIRIEIEDNGKGIPQQDLQRIFDRFYRTDTSRNSAQGGSGIGLSIVKKIIEDHGGYIWATGKEGEGTCMHFVLRKYVELSSEPIKQA